MASFKNTIPFSPRSIAGCQLWLDSADSSTFTLSGTNISQWLDKSSTKAIFTASSTNPTQSSTTYNGLKPISFGGSAFFQNTSFVYTTNNRSAFFVYDEVVEQNNVGILSFASSGTDFNQLNTMVYETGFKSSNQYLQVAQSFGNGGYALQIQMSSIGFALYSDTFGSGTETAFVNGTQTATTTSGGAFTNSTGLVIGGRMLSGSVGNLLNGVIGEIILFNRAVTTSERQQIEGYLAWKWGLTGNLPTTHPFKNGFVPFSFSLVPSKTRFTQTFDPRLISGLQLWLDAADPTTLTLIGTSVTQWSDKSGNRNNFTQESATRYPVYTVNAINSLPSISFTGGGAPGSSTQCLDNSTISINNTAYSIFCVARANASQPSYTGYNYLLKGFIGGDFYLQFGNNPSKLFSTFAGSSSGWNDINANSPSVSVSSTTLILGMVISGSVLTPYYNGNTMSTKNGTTGSYSGMRIGDAPNIGNFTGQCWNGLISEIIIFNLALTTAQRQQVEGYLARKWGLSANLATTHPNTNPLTIAPFPHAISRISIAPTAKWLPTQVSGCALWLDAADAATVILSGTNVTQWNDKSGNGRNVTKTSATTNPVYTVNTLNRLPVLVNTGTSGLSGTLAVNTLTNMTIFVVCNDTNAAELANNTGGYVLWWNETGGWGQIQLYISQSRLDWRFGTGQAENKPTFNLPSNVSTNYNIACISKSSRAETGFLNGNLLASYTAANAAIANTSSSFVITGPVGATYATNNVAEILIFTSAITTNQRETIEGYLAWKWGLQANLSSAHPYAKFPPTP